MSRAGSSSRKLPARTSSTSWHSLGEALWTLMARGRLLAAARARIFVPLPRRVGPTAKPLFLRWPTSYPQKLLPDSVCRPHADVQPADGGPVSVCRSAPTVGSGDDRFDTEDICSVTLATALRFPAPKARHSELTVCHARAAHVCPNGSAVATPVPTLPTVRRSLPSVHAFVSCRVLQSISIMLLPIPNRTLNLFQTYL